MEARELRSISKSEAHSAEQLAQIAGVVRDAAVLRLGHGGIGTDEIKAFHFIMRFTYEQNRVAMPDFSPAARRVLKRRAVDPLGDGSHTQTMV